MGFENFKAIAINTLLGSVLGIGFNDSLAHIILVSMELFLVSEWDSSWIFVTNHLSINKNFSAIHIKKLSIKKLHLKDFSILYTYSFQQLCRHCLSPLRSG